MKLLKAEAGVNDGKAGLLSAAGLFAKGGIFDKKSESFNIQELDPYLLFDARSSMLGTLENPTLDLDPATPSTLDVITATRAGIATYTDPDGNIATASADTVRVDHVDGVPMILVEPSATNLVTYSEDFSQWADSNVGIFDGVPSPDGLTNAQNIQPSATSGVHLISSHGASSAIKTYSVYAKPNGYKYFRFNTGSSGNGYAEFDVESGAVVNTGGTYYSSSSIEDVGNGWFRCSMTLSAGAATNITIALEDNAQNVNFLADGTSGLYLWGAQVEAGSVATSYIPTSGGDAAARTRAADDLEISGSDFTDFYNQSEGTVYFEGTSNGISDPRLFEFSDGTASNIIKSDINDGSNFRASVIDGSSVIVSEQSSFTGASSLFRAALSFKVNDFEVNDFEGNLNGVSLINETPASLPTVNQFHVGSNYDGNSKHLNGHIKRLIYWPTHSSRL